MKPLKKLRGRCCQLISKPLLLGIRLKQENLGL